MELFRYKVRVRYSEVDQLGVAYYAHYLSWFEEARVEFLRQAGIVYAELEKKGIRLPVSDCRVKYLAPARYDDLLIIETMLTQAGKASVIFRYRVLHEESKKLLAEGETTLVCVDSAFKPIRLPEALRLLWPVSTGE